MERHFFIFFPRDWVYEQACAYLDRNGYYRGHSLSLRNKGGAWWFWSPFENPFIGA
jgi:hypothetical protein